MRTLATLLALLAAAPAFAGDQDLLFIGNSYTYSNDLPAVTERLLEAAVAAWPDVLVEHHTRGGARLSEHLADADGSNGETPLKAALGPTMSWQWAVLQEQSQIPGFDMTDPAWTDSRDGAVGLDALLRPRGARAVLMMTWGRRDGDNTNRAIYPDFLTMQARLTAGYLAYASAMSADGEPAFVAPVGLAFRRIYEDIEQTGGDPTAADSAFTRLYVADGSHPSVQGTYLAGCVLLATVTGRSPVGIAWAPAAISTSDRGRLQAVAAQVVLDDPFGEVPYPWATSWAGYRQASDAQGGGKIISAIGVLPLVRLDTAASPEQVVRIGAQHNRGVGDGRVRIIDGGELRISRRLTVGGAGSGEIEQRGGAVDAAEIMIAEAATSTGRYHLSGGTLRTDGITAGMGAAALVVDGGALSTSRVGLDLDQRGGLLRSVGATTIDGTYALSATASVSVTVASNIAVGLRVEGDATLRGALDVIVTDWAPGVASVVALDAAGIDADGAKLTVSAGAELSLQPAGSRWQLVVNRIGGAVDAGTDPGSGFGNTPQPPSGDDSSGCSCAATPGVAQWASPLLALVLLGGLRRRRRVP